MNPRLRSMVVDSNMTVLILDRTESLPEFAKKSLIDMLTLSGVAKVLIFPFAVDLPGVDEPAESGTPALFADEFDALYSASRLLRTGPYAGDAAAQADRIADTLHSLMQRAGKVVK